MYTENQDGVDPPTVCLGSGSVFYLYIPPPPSPKNLFACTGFHFPDQATYAMRWDGMMVG